MKDPSYGWWGAPSEWGDTALPKPVIRPGKLALCQSAPYSKIRPDRGHCELCGGRVEFDTFGTGEVFVLSGGELHVCDPVEVAARKAEGQRLALRPIPLREAWRRDEEVEFERWRESVRKQERKTRTAEETRTDTPRTRSGHDTGHIAPRPTTERAEYDRIKGMLLEAIRMKHAADPDSEEWWDLDGKVMFLTKTLAQMENAAA